MDRVQIKFYTRSGCRLCDESLQILESVADELGLVIDRVDIETSRELTHLYDWHVPVATLNGNELFRHRVDVPTVRAMIEEHRSSGGMISEGGADRAPGR